MCKICCPGISTEKKVDTKFDDFAELVIVLFYAVYCIPNTDAMACNGMYCNRKDTMYRYSASRLL